MTKHLRALPPGAIELKGDDDDPVKIVTEKIEELTTAFAETKSALEKDLNETKTALAAQTKRADTLELKLARPNVHTKDKDEPSEERKSFVRYVRKGKEALFADEVKALRVADDTAGGYLAPAEFSTEVLKRIVEISPVRQAARVGNTSSGSVVLPVRTGRPTASWVGETEGRPETGSTYGQIEIPIHEAACYVDVSTRLLEDSAVNIESEVASDLAEEFGRLEGGVFLNGNGVKKPLGMLADPAIVTVASGNASTLGSAPADLLIDFLYSMPAFYRNSGTWMMNGATLATIRKLKDSSQGYLWQPSLAEGSPQTILGRPVIEAPDMPNVGAGALPILFGDFTRGYRIYDRVALSLKRDEYTQATNGLVRFHARRRLGGAMVMPEAIKAVRIATS